MACGSELCYSPLSTIIMLVSKELQNHYLDRVNQFLTDQGFADYFGLELDEAILLIQLGKKVHERLVNEYKFGSL